MVLSLKKSCRMLGKSGIQKIRSLEYKKFRIKEHLFLAEGEKLIMALLDSEIEIENLVCTARFLSGKGLFPENVKGITEAEEKEIASASFLKSPPPCLALCRIPDYPPELVSPAGGLVLCIDGIQDPGNLGTMVRLAEWFGIPDIVCSPTSADIYSPKAVQATMGAIAGVRVHYLPLDDFLAEHLRQQIPVIGTFMDGENIYNTSLPLHGIIVAGSEGSGISRDLHPFISQRITIPDFSEGLKRSESLNVSVAMAIVLSEFKRRSL